MAHQELRKWLLEHGITRGETERQSIEMVLDIYDQIKARMEETEGVTLIRSLDPLLGAEI